MADPMVTLKVNGEERRFEEAPTVAELVRRMGIAKTSVAVEVNRAIVPRSAHEDRRLSEGDEVEIVAFVGGG